MDAYKFASIKTSEHLSKVRTEKSYLLPSAVQEYYNFVNALSRVYPDKEIYSDDLNQLFREHLELQAQSEKTKIDEFISILYVNQEPFICNS